MPLVIPSERSADGPPQREESSYRQVGRRPSVGEEDRANVIDRPGGPTVIEGNCPDVVQRHVPEKRVAAQVELLELYRIGAHACHRLSRAASLSRDLRFDPIFSTFQPWRLATGGSPGGDPDRHRARPAPPA